MTLSGVSLAICFQNYHLRPYRHRFFTEMSLLFSFWCIWLSKPIFPVTASMAHFVWPPGKSIIRSNSIWGEDKQPIPQKPCLNLRGVMRLGVD